MEHFVIEDAARKGRYRIVCIGSRVGIGKMSLEALKAPKTLKVENLTLADAEANKANLEILIAKKWEHLKRAK